MRNQSFLCFLVLTLATLSATAAHAQQPPQPTRFHEQLAREAGVWNASCKLWVQPGGEQMLSQGKETCAMLGGFWLTSEFEGEFFGQPFTGHGHIGYDAESGEYVSTWIDSMTPDLFVSRGKYDVATNTLTLIGKGRDAMTGKLEDMKLATHYQDNDHKTMEMHHKVEGEWVKTMEIAYTRAK